jgi:hypothetical protein
LEECITLLDEAPLDAPGGRGVGRAHLKVVLNDFDFIGFVNDNYWTMEQEIVEWLSPSIAKVWERIGAYIEWEASRRNEPDYYEAARTFGQYCIKWRSENQYGPSNKIESAT